MTEIGSSVVSSLSDLEGLDVEGHVSQGPDPFVER
jgi:hypothetical protein